MSDASSNETPEPVRRPKINPSFVPVEVSPNEVQFRAGPWSGPVVTLEDDGGDGQLAALVDRLDGSNTTAEVLSAFAPSKRETMREVVHGLRERNIVYESADGRETERDLSSRPRWLSGPDLARIDSASVLVAGPPEMVSPVVADLLRTDVDAVLTVPTGADASTRQFDDERVEPTTRDEFDASIAAVDLAVAFANRPRPDLFAEINRVAHERETAWLGVRTYGYDSVVGPLVVPGESSCYECLRRRRDANVPSPDAYAAFEEAASGNRSPGPDIRAFERVVTGLATVDALNYLAFGFGFTVGRIVHHDFAVFSMAANDVLPMPQCPVCGGGTGVDSNRHVTLDELVEGLDRGGRH